MGERLITTSSATTTIVVSLPCGGTEGDRNAPCRWHEMHHYDDNADGTGLVHHCPTGFVLCHEHFGVGTITGPATCHLWDEHPASGSPAETGEDDKP